MPSMKGDLNAPMTNEMYTQLENMLQSEDIRCKDLAETYFYEARTKDMPKDKIFCNEPIIINFRETLHFFKKYELFDGASQQADLFDQFILEQSKRIE